MKEATSGTSEASERPAAWAGTKLVGVEKVMVMYVKWGGVKEKEERVENVKYEVGKLGCDWDSVFSFSFFWENRAI